MRTWKKVLAFVLALTMVIGVAVPSSFAIGTEKVTTGTFKTEEVTKTKPDKTTVNIYKVKADSFDGSKVPAEHNLGQLTKDQLAGMGSKVDFLAGVKFTYYTVTKEQFDVLMADPGKYKTAAQVDAKYPGLTKVTTEKATDTNGLVSVKLEEGYYWFVEDSYTPPKDSTSSISSSIALPFGLSLPYTNPKDITIGNDTYPAGTAYLKTIYIYPKNVVGDEPVIEKDVKEIGNKTATYNVGVEHPWAINTTVPANIKDYKKFILTDTIDSRLDYVGNVVVAYGQFNDKDDLTKIKNVADENKLVLGTDYTLEQPTVNAAGGELKVTLTEDGIKKLGTKYNAAYKLYVYFETKINSTATMGKPIPNDVTLTFNNGQGENKETKPKNPPVVITGGKRFVKIDVSNKKKLPGAVFELLDNKITKEDKTIKWTKALLDANAEAIKDGKFATDANGTASSDTNKPNDGDPIRLLSNAEGDFEIKGLELTYEYKVEYKKVKNDKGELEPKRPLEIESVNEDTKKVVHEYQLKEVKAPANYALPSGNDAIFAFTVTYDSYWKNPLTEDDAKLQPADPLPINNTKLTIPQTGGMGTVLFTVVGLALMGGAFVAFRKNKKAYEEAE